MFFHTAGHRFGYDNMHYVLVAGGNAFTKKRKSAFVTQPVPPAPIEGLDRALTGASEYLRKFQKAPAPFSGASRALTQICLPCRESRAGSRLGGLGIAGEIWQRTPSRWDMGHPL